MLAGAQAQVFLYEDFSASQMPPAGWSISSLPAQWTISQTDIASNYLWYAIPEGKFKFTSADTTTVTRLISPVIDLSGLTSVKFHFQYYYQYKYTPGPTAGVATRSAGGDWTTVWSVTPRANDGPKDITVTISNSDVGSNQFQFCLFLNGDMYNISYWYFDNISLVNPVPDDGWMISLSGTPDHIAAPAPVKGRVMNTGSDTIHSAMIQWKLNNGTVHTISLTGLTGLSVPPFSFFEFTSPDLMDPQAGHNNLVVWIHEINGGPDGNHSNDTLSMDVQMVSHQVNRKPLFEEFTSSTCDVCPSFDDLFNPWCDSIGDGITMVKYQMNFPGEGDPYYTPEGGERRDFYGVDAVPTVYCDGPKYLGNVGLHYVRQAYANESSGPGMMDISSTHTLIGHKMAVNTTIIPYADFNFLRLYIAVIEKTTYNNVGSNADTAFRHVMMKMVPDGYGTPLNLVDQQPYMFTDTVDLDSTHVERWNDLMVVAWVQDTVYRFVYPDWKKQVYQSCNSVEYITLSTEDRLSNILVNGSGIADFNRDKFSYSVQVPAGTVSVPDVKGIPIDSNETVVVTPAQVIPGTTTLDVYAQNNSYHNLYNVGFIYPNGIEGMEVNAVSVYPNPAMDRVFITGAAHARITLYSCTGEEIQKAENFTETFISLSGLSKGIYILKIEKPDGEIIQTKLVIE